MGKYKLTYAVTPTSVSPYLDNSGDATTTRNDVLWFGTTEYDSTPHYAPTLPLFAFENPFEIKDEWMKKADLFIFTTDIAGHPSVLSAMFTYTDVKADSGLLVGYGGGDADGKASLTITSGDRYVGAINVGYASYGSSDIDDKCDFTITLGDDWKPFVLADGWSKYSLDMGKMKKPNVFSIRPVFNDTSSGTVSGTFSWDKDYQNSPSDMIFARYGRDDDGNLLVLTNSSTNNVPYRLFDKSSPFTKPYVELTYELGENITFSEPILYVDNEYIKIKGNDGLFYYITPYGGTNPTLQYLLTMDNAFKGYENRIAGFGNDDGLYSNNYVFLFSHPDGVYEMGTPSVYSHEISQLYTKDSDGNLHQAVAPIDGYFPLFKGVIPQEGSGFLLKIMDKTRLFGIDGKYLFTDESFKYCSNTLTPNTELKLVIHSVNFGWFLESEVTLTTNSIVRPLLSLSGYGVVDSSISNFSTFGLNNGTLLFPKMEVKGLLDTVDKVSVDSIDGRIPNAIEEMEMVVSGISTKYKTEMWKCVHDDALADTQIELDCEINPEVIHIGSDIVIRGMDSSNTNSMYVNAKIINVFSSLNKTILTLDRDVGSSTLIPSSPAKSVYAYTYIPVALPVGATEGSIEYRVKGVNGLYSDFASYDRGGSGDYNGESNTSQVVGMGYYFQHISPSITNDGKLHANTNDYFAFSGNTPSKIAWAIVDSDYTSVQNGNIDAITNMDDTELDVSVYSDDIYFIATTIYNDDATTANDMILPDYVLGWKYDNSATSVSDISADIRFNLDAGDYVVLAYKSLPYGLLLGNTGGNNSDVTVTTNVGSVIQSLAATSWRGLFFEQTNITPTEKGNVGSLTSVITEIADEVNLSDGYYYIKIENTGSDSLKLWVSQMILGANLTQFKKQTLKKLSLEDELNDPYQSMSSKKSFNVSLKEGIVAMDMVPMNFKHSEISIHGTAYTIRDTQVTGINSSGEVVYGTEANDYPSDIQIMQVLWAEGQQGITRVEVRNEQGQVVEGYVTDFTFTKLTGETVVDWSATIKVIHDSEVS